MTIEEQKKMDALKKKQTEAAAKAGVLHSLAVRFTETNPELSKEFLEDCEKHKAEAKKARIEWQDLKWPVKIK